MNQSSHTTETSHSTSQSSFWRIIWNLHIPNKIKLFTWRACQNILPTKANLCHRHVLDNLIYEAFGLAPETTGHLFWDCHIAKETWKLSDILFDKHGLSYRDFMDFLWHLVFTQHVGTDILELTVNTAWSIWFSRNKTRLGATRQPPHEIMVKARFLFMEYQDAHLRPPLFKDATDNAGSRLFFHGIKWMWTPLSSETMKVLWLLHSVSASPSPSAPSKQKEGHGWGYALCMGCRSHGRNFWNWLNQCFSCSCGPRNAKIIIACLVAGAHSKLQECHSFEVSHVKRQANFPAHALAAYAKDIDFFVSWMEECPPFIESQVFHDALSLSSY